MRRVALTIKYNGRDISEDISKHLLSFAMTDNAEGKADDLSITLEDTKDLWIGDWFPNKGATLTGSLRTTYNGAEQKLNLGSYTIDDISVSSPPNVVSIKAVSTLINKSLRREKKTRAWENVTLNQIGSDIASSHGMDLFYESDLDLVFKRQDQKEESDLSFLNRLAKEHGLSLKVRDSRIIIYDPQQYDLKAPAFTIQRNHSEVMRYSMNSKAHDIYRACEVRYFNPELKKEVSHIYTPAGSPKTGQLLKLNTRVESLAEAERKAKAALYRANKNEVTASLSISGRLDLYAGVNSLWSGFGVFDGKYAHETITHRFNNGGGFVSSIKGRRIDAG